MNSSTVTLIVASPRSGTTILGEVLGRHPEIADWYEPYFIWDYKLRLPDNDLRTADMATPNVIEFIHQEIERFQINSGRQFIVEKTPRNAFKIDFINAILPHAKWIHLFRDGRDVVSSIQKQWEQRRSRSVRHRMEDVAKVLKRQPFWRNRFQAIWFEVRTQQRMRSFLPSGRRNWQNIVGWGPRFPGWQDIRANSDDALFAAHQWLECERSIEAGLAKVNPERIIDVRYENLVTEPELELKRILEHIGADPGPIPELAKIFSPESINKSNRDMDKEQKHKVFPIIEGRLRSLGYV